MPIDHRLHTTPQPMPAVLTMHRWGANAATLWPVVPPLHAAGFAVLLLDARCHGPQQRLHAVAQRASLLAVDGDHDLRAAMAPHADALVAFLDAACAPAPH
jgi:alpha-beta hydrolase superfamily lysophospholipase